MEPGYALVPHTADIMIEAWGPTRASCFEQAARGLIASFTAVPPGAPGEPHEIALDGADDEAMLVSLLEEIVYLVDARGTVPAAVTVGDRTAVFELVPLERTEATGAAPKAVAYHELAVEAVPGGWRCRVTIDV